MATIFKASDVSRITGMSKSKLDRLFYMGILQVSTITPGSGNHRKFKMLDVIVCLLFNELKECGFSYNAIVKMVDLNVMVLLQEHVTRFECNQSEPKVIIDVSLRDNFTLSIDIIPLLEHVNARKR